MAATPQKIADLSYIKGLTGNSWTPTGRTSLVCPKYGDISSHEPYLTIRTSTSNKLVKESDLISMELCRYSSSIKEGRINFNDGYLNLSEDYGFSLVIKFRLNAINTWQEAGLIFSTYLNNTQDALGLRVENNSSYLRLGAFAKNSSSSNQYVYSNNIVPSVLVGTQVSVTYSKQLNSKNISVGFSGAVSGAGTLTPTTTNWSSYKTTYFYIGKHPQYTQFQADVTVSSISLIKNFV